MNLAGHSRSSRVIFRKNPSGPTVSPFKPMKTLILITCLSVSATVPLPASDAEPVHAAVTAAQRPDDLSRLQDEYARRRADALRPVAAWYRAQLEVLQRQSAGENSEDRTAITEALAAVRETFWHEDQPELKQALMATDWLWRSSEDADGVSMTFHADGTVEHVGMDGKWRITGPCEVTIETADHARFVLRFNASLSAYEADTSNVSGHRVAPPR